MTEQEFDVLRRSAFAIAYRMLGSVSEAEDVVQEGFLRLHLVRDFAAAEGGDLEAFEELLAHDVVLRGDGGGKAPAITRAIHGRARVARTLIAGLRTATHAGGFTLRREQVNGQPGALFFDPEGRVGGVMILDVADGQIQSVSSINNPDKLRHLGPVADLRRLLRERRQILQLAGSSWK